MSRPEFFGLGGGILGGILGSALDGGYWNRLKPVIAA